MISYHLRPASMDPTRKREEAKNYAKGFKIADTDDFRQIARGLLSHVCAPGIFRNGERDEAHWSFADWIGFDFDNAPGEEPFTLGAALENIFCDMRHIIGVTMSHQTGANPVDKFRVLLPLERRIEDLKLYRYQIMAGMKRWPADGKCKDGARLFFPCREIVSINTEGYPWEIDTNLPPEPDFAARAAARVMSRLIPPWVLQYLRTPWKELTKNDTCFRIGCALGPLGYSANEIVGFILKSPTYASGKVPIEEIAQAVANGVKRGTTDLTKQSSVYGAEHGRAEAVDCRVLQESVRADGGRGAECAGNGGVDVPG